jgi:hypothetical protein
MKPYRPWRPTPAERFAPVLYGAAIVAALTALRALLFLVVGVLRGDLTGVGRALLAIVLAAGGGAVGGLAYVLVGAPLRLIPRVGRYLAGIVTVAAYLGVLIVLIGYVDPNAGLSLAEPSGRFAFASCTLLFGIVMGHTWFSELR